MASETKEYVALLLSFHKWNCSVHFAEKKDYVWIGSKETIEDWSCRQCNCRQSWEERLIANFIEFLPKFDLQLDLVDF